MIIAVALFYLYARIGLVGTSLGLVLGHTVLAVPYVVVTIMAVLKNYDERLDQAAGNLGANPARTLWHITFPLIRPGLIAAFLFAFVTSLDKLTIAHVRERRPRHHPAQADVGRCPPQGQSNARRGLDRAPDLRHGDDPAGGVLPPPTTTRGAP